jgi:hypothetical protein
MDQRLSAKTMKLEQPGQWNVLLAGVGSHDRRTLFKEILPVLVFCCACGLAIVAMTAFFDWIEGRTAQPFLRGALLAGIGFTAVPLVVAELLRQAQLRTRRILELNDEGVTASHYRPSLKAAWREVRQFEIEPVNSRDDLAQVTVTAALGRKGVMGRFSMILDRAKQLPAFVDELARRNSPARTFAVVELPRAMPFERRGIRGLWPAMIGMFLLLIGFPVMAAGLLDTGERDRLATRPPVQVQRFVKKHFQSAAEVRRSFIFAGGSTCCVGLALYVWGWCVLDKRGKLAQADVRSRLERIRNDPSSKVMLAVS